MNKETLLSLDMKDLQLYYVHSYLRWRNDVGQHEWILVDGFAENPNGYLIGFRDSKNKSHTRSLSTMALDFNVPKPGFYNYRNSSIYFTRNPVRNHIKGLTSQNVMFQNLMERMFRLDVIPKELYQSHKFQLSTQGLTKLFEEQARPSFIRSLEKIAKNQVFASAISDHLALSPGIISKNPTIWFKTRAIGELDASKAVVYPILDAFVPELTDFFPKYGIEVRG